MSRFSEGAARKARHETILAAPFNIMRTFKLSRWFVGFEVPSYNSNWDIWNLLGNNFSMIAFREVGNSWSPNVLHEWWACLSLKASILLFIFSTLQSRLVFLLESFFWPEGFRISQTRAYFGMNTRTIIFSVSTGILGMMTNNAMPDHHDGLAHDGSLLVWVLLSPLPMFYLPGK